MEESIEFDDEFQEATGLAMVEAVGVGQRTIDSGHLLLGLIQAGPRLESRQRDPEDWSSTKLVVRLGNEPPVVEEIHEQDQRKPGTVVSRVFGRVGLDLDRLRDEMPALNGPPIVGAIDHAADTDRAVEFAVTRARARGDRFVTALDLLVGVLDAEGTGCVLLRMFSVTPQMVREAIAAETSA